MNAILPLASPAHKLASKLVKSKRACQISHMSDTKGKIVVKKKKIKQGMVIPGSSKQQDSFIEIATKQWCVALYNV